MDEIESFDKQDGYFTLYLGCHGTVQYGLDMICELADKYEMVRTLAEGLPSQLNEHEVNFEWRLISI